jgi:hypothetical protein
MKKNKFLIASILCYCFSLILPTIGEEGMIGVNALIYGWMGFIDLIDSAYVFGLAWLANFVYFLNLFLSRVINIWFQVLLSITTLFLSIPALVTEVGYERVVMKMHLGSWFWFLSFLVLAIGQIQLVIRK